jgi:primosomal replication protein N
MECLIGHQSEQLEAVATPCRMRNPGDCPGCNGTVAAGGSPGAALQLTGFLAARSRNSKQPRLHITTIEFVEGNQDGKVLQEEG